MSKLIEKAKALLAEGEVALIIGFEQGNHGTRPFFCRQPQEADKLILNEQCTNNLAVYLTKQELPGKDKVAFTANLATLRSILELSAENQWKEDKYLVLVSDKQGEVIELTKPGEIEAYLQDYPLAANEENRQLLNKVRAMTPEERWKFWTNELSKCIKCYACRAACPLCYCTRCIVEVNCPQWIQPWAATISNMEWQINRAMHMAGRCVGCGACKKACPVGIPIHLLTLSMMEDIQQEFGKAPGSISKNGNVLSTFRVEDKENFIR